MAERLGAVLVAEVGSLITRVTLIDHVEGEYRMVSHAETSSSVEAPYYNVLYGMLEGAAAISELTGRQLLRDSQLLMPQTSEGDGVDQVVVVTSAAGTMALVITAIAADVSARSAIHASRAIYSAVLQVVTLDDAAGQPALGPADRSWIERQVETLLSLHPDSVLIAGGLEQGAVDAVNRLAHIVGLTALSSGVDASGQQRQEVTARPVIYAGNSGARERVVAALSDRAELFLVDNLRPALDKANLDPTRQELTRLYEKQILPRLPGIGNLRRLSRVPLRTVCEVEGLLARFLAERTGRRVLSVDVGASASAAFYAAPERYHPAVLGTLGTVYGLTGLLTQPGVAALTRWLPFPIDEAALTERLLNRVLRPQVLPSSREDIYIEHALVREALRTVYAALSEETAVADYDWLLAGGGVLAHTPQPGLALLTLLDALEPTGEHAQPIMDVHLDTLGLMVVAGALVAFDPDAAVTVIDRDLLRRTASGATDALASVVTLLGAGRLGDAAAEVELSVVGGGTQRISVRHGEIVRLPLPQGHSGQLKIQPASGTRVGTAAPGEVVQSDGGDVAGSSLGVVIDARGRPLSLPQDADQRRALLWQWLVALGVETGQSPYADASSAPLLPAQPLPLPATAPIPAPVAAPVPAPAAVPAAEPLPPAMPVPPFPAPMAEVGERQTALDQLVAEEPPPASTEVVAAGAGGRRISLDELRAQETGATTIPLSPPVAPAAPPPALDQELDSLRQTLEQPKRRGLFGRKK